MNKALLLIFLLPFSLFAQSFVRCNTTEHYKQFKETHPEIVQQESEMNLKVAEWLSRNNRIGGNREDNTNSVITIPVVVHIVYYSSSDSLSDQVVQSEIDVLNKDYSRTNADTSATPPAFRIVAGNPQIQFCLAQRTPANQWTNGIERRQIFVSPVNSTDAVKFYSSGGLDAWNVNQYLNIWVCNISGLNLGISSFPSQAGTPFDGVVIDYTAFGTTGSVLNPQYNKGRTATHEIGHWLGLYHPWGDHSGTCTESDSIADTPNQLTNTFGCPTYPKTDACSPGFPGIMFMNYMDYTDDVCMNMFSYDQAQKMNAVLNTVRSSILASPGCVPVGIDEIDFSSSIQVYPNPATEELWVMSDGLWVNEETSLEFYNVLGANVKSAQLITHHSKLITKVDVSSLAPGIYQLVLRTKNGIASKKISIVN